MRLKVLLSVCVLGMASGSACGRTVLESTGDDASLGGAGVAEASVDGVATGAGGGGVGGASGSSGAGGDAASGTGDAHGVDAGDDCPPIVLPFGVESTFASVSAFELYATAHGLVANTLTFGYRGGTLYSVQWLPFADPTPSSLNPSGCSLYSCPRTDVRAWGDWAWVRVWDQLLRGGTLVPFDLRQRPPVAGQALTPADVGDFAFGPGGLVHSSEDRSMLLHRMEAASPPVTIATFSEAERPTALDIAVGDTDAFVVAHVAGQSSRLLRVPLVPGSVEHVASVAEGYCCGTGTPALGAGEVYLSLTLEAGYELRSIDLATGAAETVASITARDVALGHVAVDRDFVYWREQESSAELEDRVLARRHCGGEPTVVAALGDYNDYYGSVEALAVGERGVYFTSGASIVVVEKR